MAANPITVPQNFELLKFFDKGYDAEYRVLDDNGYTSVLKLCKMQDIIDSGGTGDVDCVTIGYLLDSETGFVSGHVTILGKTLEAAELTILYDAYDALS